MLPLSLNNLNEIANKISTPNYERKNLTAGIVHFGIGNFHRAHQAVYLHNLFNLGKDHDWAIIGAGVTAYDNAMRNKLVKQDYLTTVVEQDIAKSNAYITGSMIDYLNPLDNKTIIQKLADPAIKIVSMTITEGGYFINPATSHFDLEHAAIVKDSQNPLDPKTVFGIIIAGLKLRRDTQIPPFTVMSCDNIPGNGHVTQNAVVGLAGLFDKELAAWIKTNVAFPNSMVDRITPATSQRELSDCQNTYGIEDNCPVYCEDFTQWVLEDNFTSGRPKLEDVGVTFVKDVAPYELMKIRILNGGHAAIAYPAELLDIVYVHEAMQDETIRNFLAKLEHSEIIPCVPPVPNTNLNDYFELIENRLLNPKIGDTIARLAQDGSNRQPKFILPSTADRLQKNQSIKGLALVSALWCKYFQGYSDTQRQIIFNDENSDRLHSAALAAKDNPIAFLQLRDIFGEVGQSSVFQQQFTLALQSLYSKGTRATLIDYINEN